MLCFFLSFWEILPIQRHLIVFLPWISLQMYLIVLGLSTESSLKFQWIEVSLKVLDVKTLEFKIDFIVKEDLDKLIVTERSESIVPLIYALCFLMAFYGPNADNFGNIKLSLWQYQAISDPKEYVLNICLLGSVDSLSFVFNGVLLWATCQINVLETLKNLQKDYWLLFAIQISHSLIQVRKMNFTYVSLFFKMLLCSFLLRICQMEELIIHINLIGLMASMLSTTLPIGNHNHEMEPLKKT